MTQEERYEIIDGIVEDRAWSNQMRHQVEGKNQNDGIEYGHQEVLDQFRALICCKLAYMSDDTIPAKHEDCWEFIHNNWSEFIHRFYGIIQTWEEYKNSDAFRLA